MNAPTGVFRKFHGKELDLKEQYIYKHQRVSFMIFCVYLLPQPANKITSAFIGFISTSHDSDVSCTIHILHPKVFQKSFLFIL